MIFLPGGDKKMHFGCSYVILQGTDIVREHDNTIPLVSGKTYILVVFNHGQDPLDVFCGTRSGEARMVIPPHDAGAMRIPNIAGDGNDVLSLLLQSGRNLLEKHIQIRP